MNLSWLLKPDYFGVQNDVRAKGKNFYDNFINRIEVEKI